MTKNITLSADEELINKARQRAQKEKRSLNEAFREWLTRYAAQDRLDLNYDELMDDFSYAKPGRKFSRDEMNER